MSKFDPKTCASVEIPVLGAADSLRLQEAINKLYDEKMEFFNEKLEELSQVFDTMTNLEAIILLNTLIVRIGEYDPDGNDVPIRTLGSVLLSTLWKDQAIGAGAIPAEDAAAIASNLFTGNDTVN